MTSWAKQETLSFLTLDLEESYCNGCIVVPAWFYFSTQFTPSSIADEGKTYTILMWLGKEVIRLVAILTFLLKGEILC